MADKKIVDIAGPTDTKVDIGSKPMIVGHKSMASDPMMREKTESKSDTPETPPEPSSSEAKNPEQEVVTSKAETIEPPSVKQKTIEPLTEENKPAEKAEQPVTPKPEDSDKAEVTDKPEVSEKSDKANAELDATALELEKEENLRKIIDSKKYHVNIKQARGESKSWVYVLIGIIFATLIALFVLIDTGKLDVGIKLPFSIFSEKENVSSQPQIEENTQVQTEKQEVEESTIKTESKVPEVVENKKTVQNVSILLAEDGDELKLSNTAPASFVEYMKSKLTAFNCNIIENGTGITVNKISEEFASGIVFCDDGYYAYWYLKDGQWMEYSEDVWYCNEVQTIGIPVEFMSSCIDSASEKSIPNPNGSINQ